jgi:hypothetical protein
VHLDAKGMVVIAAPGMTIEHSQFDNSSAAGLMTAAANVTMNHVTVVDNGSVGMDMNKSHNSLVQNSQFSRNNAEHFNVTACGESCTIAGIKATRGDQMKFINNAFVDNDSTGWWCDIACSNVTFAGNAISGSTVNGIFYEISSVGSFTNNYIANAARGFKVAGSDRVTITNNTFVNNTQQTGIYDDARLSTSDYYGAALGQSWDTTDLILDYNTFIGGSKTTRLLDNNATVQVAGPQMFASAKNNTVSGNQTMVWCRAEESCALHSTIASWAAASGYSFGTVATATTTTSMPATTVSPTTTTTSVPATTVSPTTTTTSVPATTVSPTTTVAPTTTASATTTAAPTMAATPVASANLLRDPGFERGLRWEEFGHARVWISSSQYRSGHRSLGISGRTKGVDADGATASPLPVSSTVAGRTYTASCYVTSTTPIDVGLFFQEYQQNWVPKADAFRGPEVRTQSIGTWSKISVIYQAKYSGMLLPLTVHTTDLTRGGAKLYVDDCSVVEAI